ncbi:MAG TPA: 5-(carboxyamino)imidazole ribonucleotide mutase, partial [Tepiditoga sp.]|nr:5-(carboxyamino)imidazole ribonucleotide mutase [Tepiditoga sp.]
SLGGLDSLLSILQMPKSVPVATVGIDNSFNAAMLSVEILALKYPDIKEKLKNYRKNMKENFIRDYEKGVDFGE